MKILLWTLLLGLFITTNLSAQKQPTETEPSLDDDFSIGILAPRWYVQKGERFNAKIFPIGLPKEWDYTIRVNTSLLELDDSRKGIYSCYNTSSGERNFKVTILASNPKTGLSTRVEQVFSYFVGMKLTPIVYADKMNVLYAEALNPISIDTRGIDPNSIEVSVNGDDKAILEKGKGEYAHQYFVTPSKRGNLEIVLTDKGTNQKIAGFRYRVKRAPDPSIGLDIRNRGGNISARQMKTSNMLIATINHFDFQCPCNVESFEFVYAPKGGEMQTIINSGNELGKEAKTLIEKASVGDIYIFQNVRVKCCGDRATRRMSGISFIINKN